MKSNVASETVDDQIRAEAPRVQHDRHAPLEQRHPTISP
jgi:hypothetical protein